MGGLDRTLQNEGYGRRRWQQRERAHCIPTGSYIKPMSKQTSFKVPNQLHTRGNRKLEQVMFESLAVDRT